MLNFMEVNTRKSLLQDFGGSVGVREHGMYGEKCLRTWETLLVPSDKEGRATQSIKRMFKGW
jgi:hypothetical protein